MLRIRPFKEMDTKYVAEWPNDPRTFQMWSGGHFQYPLTEEQLKAYYKKEQEDCFSQSFVAVNQVGTPVGFFRFRNMDYTKNTVHMGFILVDEKMRGKGYGKEMVRLAVKYAFEMLQMNVITLTVFAENVGAQKCYQAVGFQYTSFDEQQFTYKDETWDLYTMEIQNKARVTV